MSVPIITYLELVSLDQSAVFGDQKFAMTRSAWEQAGRPMQVAFIAIPSQAGSFEDVVRAIVDGLDAEQPAPDPEPVE